MKEENEREGLLTAVENEEVVLIDSLPIQIHARPKLTANVVAKGSTFPGVHLQHLTPSQVVLCCFFSPIPCFTHTAPKPLAFLLSCRCRLAFSHSSPLHCDYEFSSCSCIDLHFLYSPVSQRNRKKMTQVVKSSGLS